MSKNLALQKAMRAAFTSSADVLALVPAANIIDRHELPPPAPSVILGDAVVRQSPSYARDREEVFSTLHVWADAGSTVPAWMIIDALRRALDAAFRPTLEGGYHLVEWMIWDSRVLRDPSGASHGLATVRAVIGGGA